VTPWFEFDDEFEIEDELAVENEDEPEHDGWRGRRGGILTRCGGFR
jgi:hypothetical protein